jgi:hypothetical protein
MKQNSRLKDSRNMRIRLIELCRVQGIKGLRAPFQLQKAYRNDSIFRAEWHSIWGRVVNVDGGKIGFGAALGILGLVLGGVGLAGAWGAIGVPLVLILVPLGFLAGNELDQYRNKGAVELPSSRQAEGLLVDDSLPSQSSRLSRPPANLRREY